MPNIDQRIFLIRARFAHIGLVEPDNEDHEADVDGDGVDPADLKIETVNGVGGSIKPWWRGHQARKDRVDRRSDDVGNIVTSDHDDQLSFSFKSC